MKYKKFEELPIWQLAIKLTKIVYDITIKPSFVKDFGLKDQVRRAAVSISANIVEGFEKNNNNEFIRFLRIAKGSAGETRNHFYIAKSVGYIDQREFDVINSDLEKLANEIGGFIVYLDNFRKKQSVIRNS